MDPDQRAAQPVPAQRSNPADPWTAPTGPPPQRRPTAEAPPGGFPWPVPAPAGPTSSSSGGHWLWWLLAALLVVAVVVSAVILRLTVFGPDQTRADTPSVTKGQPQAPTATGAPGPEPQTSPQPQPAPVSDLQPITVTADSTSPPSVDDSGRPVSYDARNVADGLTDTAWRTAGDASSQSLHFDFGRPVHLTTVGLLPGYAKTDPDTGADRFPQNRRVASVAWTADDGYSVVQDCRDERTLQTIAFDRTTTTLTLTILGTTAPGERDFTALSEVEFTGRAS